MSFFKTAKTQVLAYTNGTTKGFGYSKTASLNKISSYYKEQLLGTIDVKAKLETVADTYKISKNPEDYVFVSVRALTANVPNENNDCFMEDELLRFDQKHGCKVYATFNLKPHHVNHRSSDPTQARGCIIDVHYNTKNAEHFPELLIAVDKTKDKRLAEGIASGEQNAFSMGCSCEHTLCSICGNKASTPSEFCTHISLYKGKEVEGKLAFEDCRKVGFEEESSVDDPADKLALTQEVILASKGDTVKDMAIETEFLAVNTKLNGLSANVQRVLKQLENRTAAKTAAFNAEEIAETFVNGNISDARRAIGNSVSKFNAVLSALEEMGQETESFRRLMTKDASVKIDIQAASTMESFTINNLRAFYNDFYEVWQVISPDGRTLGEFRTSDAAKTWMEDTTDFIKKADTEKLNKLDALQKEIRRLLDTKDDSDYQKAKELMKEKDRLFNEIYEVKTFKADNGEIVEDASLTKPYGVDSPDEEEAEEDENQDDLETYKKKKEDEANKEVSSEELGVVTTMANKKKAKGEEAVWGDMNFVERHDLLVDTLIEGTPTLSRDELIDEELDEFVSMGLTHLKDELDETYYDSLISKLANKKIKSNGGTMSVNIVKKEANPYSALKKKAVDSAAKEYWEKVQPGYGKDMTKDIKKKKLQALLEKKRAEKASEKTASDTRWKNVQKGSGNPPTNWKNVTGKGNPPKEFKNAKKVAGASWKNVQKGSGNPPTNWKNVTGKGNPPKEFKFAKLYQDIQAFPAGNMVIIAKALRPIYIVSNVSPNGETKVASETKAETSKAILRAIASKGLKVAMDEYKAQKLQALYPTVKKPSIVDSPEDDLRGDFKKKPFDGTEKGGDDDLTKVDRSKLSNDALDSDGTNDIKLAKRKADVTKLIDMIEAEQAKGTPDNDILKMVDTYIETEPNVASKKSSISEKNLTDLVTKKTEPTKGISSNGSGDLAKVKGGSERANEIYSGGKDDLTDKRKNVVTIEAKKAMTAEAQKFISEKIETLIGEGKPQDQAVAIAYSMAREKGFDVPEKSASVRSRILIDKKAIKAEIESEVKKAAAIEVAEYKTAFRQRFLRALTLANLRATKNLIDNPLKKAMADVLYTPTKNYIGMDMEMAVPLVEESFAKGAIAYIDKIMKAAESFIEMPEESFLAIEDDTKKLNLVIPVADVQDEAPGDFGDVELDYEVSPTEELIARAAGANPIFVPTEGSTGRWDILKGILSDRLT